MSSERTATARALPEDAASGGAALPRDGLVTSAWKIAGDRQRLAEYLAGKPIYPLSIELDLTDVCNRSCPGCPSVGASSAHYLGLPFLDRLLGMLGGRSRGLLLTGGEPTIAPLFAPALALARRRGFEQIAVVSNGKCLEAPRVARALLEHVTSLRVSLYDWEQGPDGPLGATLRNLRRLRESAERAGSELSVGVSVLTDRQRIAELRRIVAVLAENGAHWVYFHPRCEGWELGRPQAVDQRGVLDEIAILQRDFAATLPVYVGGERYGDEPLEFSTYHAAHFLLVVGADGKNYLSPETKYVPRYVLDDLGAALPEDFLWRSERLARMRHPSRTYDCLGSRHRTQLYNAVVERLRDGVTSLDAASARAERLVHRYIL